MSQDVEINYSLLVSTDLSYSELRKIEITSIRLLGLISRFTGGDPNITKFVGLLQKSIMWIRHLQMVIHAFEVAEGPLGWVFFAVSAMSFAFTTGDMLYSQERGKQ